MMRSCVNEIMVICCRCGFGYKLIVLLQDMALIEDKEFKKWVEVYAKDEKRFFNDFSKAFAKLTENGCTNLDGGKGWF